MTRTSQSLSPHRVPGRTLICIVVVLTVVGGCGSVSPGSSTSPAGIQPPPSASGEVDRLHRQATAALDRWTAAVGTTTDGVVIVGESTGQIGDWEASVGENDKLALMSGQIRATASLGTQAPPPGEIQWSDGTSTTVELLTAVQALNEIVKASESPCSGCTPLEVTAARLISGPVQTSRGPATAPIWEFTLRGTAVKVTHVAVRHRISLTPPPWDSSDPPEGISIDAVRGLPEARELTVSFVGAPAGGDQPCGADYTAEAVESQIAVVVIVIEHRYPTLGACEAIGAERSTVVRLASPLGDRAVLEVKEGRPVPRAAP